MVRAWLRLARWRLRRWRRRLAPPTPRGGTAPHPPRRPAAGWPLRALLWTLAAAGIACPLLALGVAGLAAARAHFAAPAPPLLLLARQGRFRGELSGNPAATAGGSLHRAREAGEEEGLGYWPVAELPPRVVAATLALEDRRFGSHPGVDPLAVARAALQNLRTRGRVSGASTLAMQVARMQSPGARGYLRKVTEALTAVFLTERYGSREVLRQYLRIVPYGNRIHGIAYAARSYFDKPVEDLSWAEIAFLAALPQAPARMNPFAPAGRERAVRRGARVLAELAGRGVLSPAEYALAQGQLAALHIPYRERRPPEALHALLHLQTLAGEGRLRAAGVAPILRTTLDLDLQRDASAMTWRALHEWRSRGAGNASLIVLDLSRHEVLAWVGSAAYFDAEDHGAIDYARVRRSAGSTLKPFLYAMALERGVIGPTTLMDDLERGPGGVANADDAFMGPLLPRVALANSRNVPAVLLLGRIGLDQGFGLFRELGLTDGAVPARHYGLGMAIGGLPVTLEELARAYLTLAGDGTLPARLRWLRDQPEPAPRRIFAEETARQVTLFLSDPQARLPSFPRMGATEFRFPVAVKTGTSTNYHDAWAVAYSTRYLAAAWVGHPGFRAMNQLSGYLSAADLVRHVLLRLHGDQGDGLEDLSFPAPRGYRPVRVCALSGHRATAACDRVFLEWFRPGEEPADDCEAHQQRAVDRRNGLLATQATPPAAVEVRTFVELPPRYAAWQAAAGLPRPPDAASQLTLPAVARWGTVAGAGTAIGFGAGEAAEPVTALPPGGRVVLAGGPTRLRITSPESGARLLRDPETPAELNTVALRVVVDPPVNEVVWYVDGLPFATAAYPYSARWRLQPGEHTFQVRLGAGKSASRPVQVTVD
ncbi:MAG TPA: transglycosylase domain-containing protein [Thermoanaerobaculia bacterium]|nr:transglycosylase domain-containing protein [Thermoanaerobaculia bacterium]